MELEIKPEPSDEEHEAIVTALADGAAPPVLPWRDETDEP